MGNGANKLNAAHSVGINANKNKISGVIQLDRFARLRERDDLAFGMREIRRNGGLKLSGNRANRFGRFA